MGPAEADNLMALHAVASYPEKVVHTDLHCILVLPCMVQTGVGCYSR